MKISDYFEIRCFRNKIILLFCSGILGNCGSQVRYLSRFNFVSSSKRWIVEWNLIIIDKKWSKVINETREVGHNLGTIYNETDEWIF